MYMSNLSGNDLVYYKENNRIMSGGFNINSILMNQNISPVLSMNKSEQVGGNVSNLFKSLAVPTGLLYLHEKKPCCRFSRTPWRSCDCQARP